MNHIKKKALGIAIAGVMYGMPVFSADITVSTDGENQTVDGLDDSGNNSLIINSDLFFNVSADNDTALTIDDGTNNTADNRNLNATLRGTINGTVDADGNEREGNGVLFRDNITGSIINQANIFAGEESGTAMTVYDVTSGVINNGTIRGNTAINNAGGSDLAITNNGLMTGILTGASADITYKNSGIAYLRVDNLGATNVENTGTFVIRSGSDLGSGDFDTTGGTTEISFESNDEGITTTGVITVDSSTVIKVSASPAILKDDNGIASLSTLGTLDLANLSVNDVSLLDIGSNSLEYTDDSGTNSFDSNTDTLKVEAGNILMKIDNINVTADDIVVDISMNSIEDVVSEIGFPGIVQDIAKKFQSGAASSDDIADLEELYGELVLNVSTKEALANYLNKIRPDDSGADAEAGIDIVNAVSGNISSRGAAIRTGMNTGDMFVADGFWVQGIFGKSEQKSNGVDLSYDGKMQGFTLGADRDKNGITVGVALSYANADTDFNDREQKESVHTYMGSLYSIWQYDNRYFDGSLSLGTSSHESKKFSGAAAETAEYDSWQLGAKGTLGYYYPIGNAVLEPMVSTRMTYVNIDSFMYKQDSDGASTGNSSGAADFKQLDFGIGAAFSTILAQEDRDLYITPRLSVMYFHDVLKDTLDKEITFAGDDYKLKSTSKERNSLEIGLSVDIASGDHVTVNAAYERVHKEDFSSDNYSFKFRYDF